MRAVAKVASGMPSPVFSSVVRQSELESRQPFPSQICNMQVQL